MDSNKKIYEKWMKYAVIEAVKGLDNGEVPIGAIIVNQGKVIGRGFNQVETLNDATAHAEMIAITSASSTMEDWRLTDSSIFVTKEPCPMCAGAILNSRIGAIVYGLADKEWGACGSYYDICRDKKSRKLPLIVGGILEQDSRFLIDEFFNKIRKR